MAHKKNPRKGRQYENIAREILYEFCFLAQPVSIGDDIGVDFFCTLFEPKQIGSDADLIPRTSFWIQIKGKTPARTIDLTSILPMLRVLQAPFFIGMVDGRRRKLEIFSGHYLLPLFVHKGAVNIKKLRAKPCEEEVVFGLCDYFQEIAAGRYVLYFPKVTELSADPDDSNLVQARERVQRSCAGMLENIGSIILEEHTLQDHNGRHLFVFSGVGSLQSFERNFFKRLGEVFFNLQNAYRFADLQQQAALHFGLYERVYLALESLYQSDPRLLLFVRPQYEQARRVFTEVR